jgi:hypothetical protein
MKLNKKDKILPFKKVLTKMGQHLPKNYPIKISQCQQISVNDKTLKILRTA